MINFQTGRIAEQISKTFFCLVESLLDAETQGIRRAIVVDVNTSKALYCRPHAVFAMHLSKILKPHVRLLQNGAARTPIINVLSTGSQQVSVTEKIWIQPCRQGILGTANVQNDHNRLSIPSIFDMKPK